MKGELYYLYFLIRWIILLLLALVVALNFIIEKPSFILDLASYHLKREGITYSSMEGGLLSGFTLKGFKYQDKVEAKELTLKFDLERLSDRVLYIENITLDGLYVEKEYLASLIDVNSSKDSDSNISLPFDRVVVDNLKLSIRDIGYREYSVKYASLKVKKFTTDMKKEYRGDIELSLNSNITKADLNGSINNGSAKIKGDITPNRDYISSFLKDNSITFKSDPTLNIDASGDMREVEYNLNIENLKLKYDKYKLDSSRLIAKGVYNIEENYLDNSLDTILNSSVAKLKLKGDTSLNLDDINRTLKFKVGATLTPDIYYVSSKISEYNLSTDMVSTFNINLNGTLKRTLFNIDFGNLNIKRDNIDLDILSSTIAGRSNILKGDIALNMVTSFNSNISSGEIKDKMRLNFYDWNSTLKYSAKVNLNPKAKYLNSLLKDKGIKIIKNPKVDISADGGVQKVNLKLAYGMSFMKDGKRANIKLKSTPIKVDISKNRVAGGLSLTNISNSVGFSLSSRFSGDYTKIKEFKTSTKVSIKNFNYFGVNLNPITPLNLNIESSKSGAYLKLKSKRVNLDVRTKDYNHLSFNLKTGNLYLYRMIKLPEELYHKFIKLDLRGDALISKRYFNIDGSIYSNKRFKARVDIKNSRFGLNGSIETKYLELLTKGNLDKRDIRLYIKTDSILNLQKEMSKLYPFSVARVDGELNTDIRLKGDRVWFNIISPKVEFDGLNIENIDIGAKYSKELITLNRFSLETTGFNDKKLNRKIKLNRVGTIHIGNKRDIHIDMLPNILVVAKGDRERLKGRVIIKNLPVGHPDYGTMFLNSRINYNQTGEKKRITGDITIKKMKLFYEAKFLDVDYDPDVVVITKETKRLKEKLGSDSFLNNTYIDIHLKAKQANYKTHDVDLLFDINLDLNKEFRNHLELIGRVEDINGRYDRVPKRFNIVNSTVVFDGGKDINPLLDIRVEYKLPQVLITILIGGYAQRPKIEFMSDPVMPKKDILSYLLLGVSSADLSSGEGSLSRKAELFILNQAARDLAYNLDLDRFFIKESEESDKYTMEIGKKFNKRDMFILETSEEGINYILEHDFSRDIKLRVEQHQNEHPSQSIDLFFRTKFK